jgi:predicted DNA-binding transcriptional regulator AlpA
MTLNGAVPPSPSVDTGEDSSDGLLQVRGGSQSARPVMTGGPKLISTILRLPAVKAETGYSRSTIYLRISQGLWPRPVNLGPRSVGWPASEVAAMVSWRASYLGSEPSASSPRTLHRSRWRPYSRWLPMDRFFQPILPARRCTQPRLPRQVHSRTSTTLPAAPAPVPRLTPEPC